MMKYSNILEEALKNKVAQDFFSKFDCTEIIKNIDFAVKLKRSANAADSHDEYLPKFCSFALPNHNAKII